LLALAHSREWYERERSEWRTAGAKPCKSPCLQVRGTGAQRVRRVRPDYETRGFSAKRSSGSTFAGGLFPALRVGAQIRVDADELEQWLYSDVGALTSRPHPTQRSTEL
jgi:hypothetical protein